MKLTDESWISYQKGKGNEEYQKYIVIIRVPDIFADSIKSLTDFSYEYGSGVEMIDPVTYTFELGDSQWVLEVMPENGWNSNEKLYRLWGYGLLIVCF